MKKLLLSILILLTISMISVHAAGTTCGVDGDTLTLKKGLVVENFDTFYCSFAGHSYKRVCTESGFTSVLDEKCNNGCEDGACVLVAEPEPEPQPAGMCKDSDGLDNGNQGKTISVFQNEFANFRDYCSTSLDYFGQDSLDAELDGNEVGVVEGFCVNLEDEQVNEGVMGQTKWFECEFGCNKGACLPEPVEPVEPEEEEPEPAQCVVEIEWFGDFQNPFDGRFYNHTYPQIVRDFGEQVEFTFKHFPLNDIHDRALPAAEAAECARDQGRFWEYADHLFTNQQALEDGHLEWYATDLNMDVAGFNKCRNLDIHLDEIQEDFDEGTERGVRGVPHFFVNDQPIPGAQPYENFRRAINEELVACGGEPVAEEEEPIFEIGCGQVVYEDELFSPFVENEFGPVFEIVNIDQDGDQYVFTIHHDATNEQEIIVAAIGDEFFLNEEGDAYLFTVVEGANGIGLRYLCDGGPEEDPEPRGDFVDLTKIGDNYLEIGNSRRDRESIADNYDFVDDSDLVVLEDGDFRTRDGVYSYEQFINFFGRGGATGYAAYTEDDDDVTDTFLVFEDNELMFEYELDFVESVESELIDGSYESMLDLDLEIMSIDYRIVQADSPFGEESLQLTLMSGAVRSTLALDDEREYDIRGEDYHVTVRFIEQNGVIFVVNGEQTPRLRKGDVYILRNDLVLGVSDILFQEGGIHRVSFFLGAEKMELRDNDLNDDESSHEVRINGETIDGAEVFLDGFTDANGRLNLNGFKVTMRADDDYFIAEGESLLEQPELDEKDLLFTQNFDILYEGMTNEETTEIALRYGATSEVYSLRFTNTQRDETFFPLYTSVRDSFGSVDVSDSLLIEPGIIQEENMFILNSADNATSVTNVVQYKSAGSNGEADPSASFRIFATGETIERPVAFENGIASFTLRLSGVTYTFESVGDTNQDDYDIRFVEASEGPGMNNELWVLGGTRIQLDNEDGNYTATIDVPDPDDYDDVMPVPVVMEFSEEDGRVRMNLVGPTLVSPDDDDDNSYGWTSMGAFIRLDQRSRSAQFRMDVPEQQRFPQVYMVSNAAANVVEDPREDPEPQEDPNDRLSWLVRGENDVFELLNTNLVDIEIEMLHDLAPVVGPEELRILDDDELVTGGDLYPYTQRLYFDATQRENGFVYYGLENDDDEVDDFLIFDGGEPLARYKMEFEDPVLVDNDLVGGKLTMLGKEYYITGAFHDREFARIDVMGGAVLDSLDEGDSKGYAIGNGEYEVELVFMDEDDAIFFVNGERTPRLEEGEVYILADGLALGIKDIFFQNGAGGIHQVEYFLGAEEIQLRDSNVEDNETTFLRINHEIIDGADVRLNGEVDGDDILLESIEILMLTEDDYYVAEGQRLSEAIRFAGDETDVLFTQNWDIYYDGLTEEETHDIRLVPNAGDALRYDLFWFDANGNEVRMYSLASLANDGDLVLGDRGRWESPTFVLDERVDIRQWDQFVTTIGNLEDGTARSFLYDFRGGDVVDGNGRITIFAKGEGRFYEFRVEDGQAMLHVGDRRHLITVTDDETLRIDLNGDGDFNDTVEIVDQFGAMITIGAAFERGVEQHEINVTITTPNEDDYDTLRPTPIQVVITEENGELELDFGPLTQLPLLEGDVYQGYTSMGAFVTLTDEIGESNEFVMEYPEHQRVPQVYIVSNAVDIDVVARDADCAVDLSGYPCFFVEDGDFNGLIVVGDEAQAVDVLAATDIAAGMRYRDDNGVLQAPHFNGAPRLASEIADPTAQNLIVIGSPCVNPVTAELFDDPADCTEGFRPGTSRVKLFEHANGNVAMVVAGFTGADTRLAGRVIATRWDELFGREVEIEGVTANDAVIREPRAEAAEEPVEEAVEE